MAEEKTMRLSLVAKQINVGTSTILQFLSAKGHKVDNNPNAKLNFEQLTLLANEFGANQLLETREVVKPVEVVAEIPVAEPIIEKVPEPIVEEKKPEPAPAPVVVEAVVEVPPVVEVPKVEAPKVEAPIVEETIEEEKPIGLKVLGKIELDKKGHQVAPKPAPKPAAEVKKAEPIPVDNAEEAIVDKAVEEPVKEVAPAVDPIIEPDLDIQLIEARGETLRGLTVLGKIELPVENDRSGGGHKHKRKRIIKEEKKPLANDGGNRPAPAGGNTQNKGKDFGKKPAVAAPGAKPLSKEELSDKDIQEQIKATMARLQGASTKQSFGAEKRKEKRKGRAEAEEARLMAEDEEAKVLKVTEFISASDLASLMDVSVNEVISTCMSLGMFVSINQRLDAEAITVIADEFSFEVSFVSAEEEIDAVEVEVEDSPEDLLPRAPIVTMLLSTVRCHDHSPMHHHHDIHARMRPQSVDSP